MMRDEVAVAILDAYPRRKMTRAEAKEVVKAWAESSGWHRDRWGNYHPREGIRIKLTKQRVQRQSKSGGRWSNLSSTPYIGAAQNLVKKAAEAADDEEALAKVTQRKARRREEREKRAAQAQEEGRRERIEAMVAKVISAEDPVGFLSMYETGSAGPEFKSRYAELGGQIDRLQRMGRTPVDQDFFRTQHPPLAPVLMDSEAQWVEEIDGVPYTVTLRHGQANRAVVEIGHIGSMGLGTRVDPITRAAMPTFEEREGDAYLSGYILRRPGADPTALLFLLQSLHKQRGAGSRVLDLWCNLMDAYGIDAWVAEAVGDEGVAFLERKVAHGRLEKLGERGSNLVMRCVGGYRGRQQQLALNPADVFRFPERPERVTIGSRTYAISDVGVPMRIGDVPADEEDEEVGAHLLTGLGTPWRYIWVYEPESGRLESYRHSDGEWKVLASAGDYPDTFRELQERGHLNRVTPEEMGEFEAEMRRRNDEAIARLQEAWEEVKGDEQREVDALVRRYFDERLRGRVERALDDAEQGVYPFDFEFNDRIPRSREHQAKTHVITQALSRAGYFQPYGTELEAYVLDAMGIGDVDELDDPQSLQWAAYDFTDEIRSELM